MDLSFSRILFVFLLVILPFVFTFPAPDENPTDVQGYGTEYNNLVISWKVIKLHMTIYFNPRTLAVSPGMR